MSDLILAGPAHLGGYLGVAALLFAFGVVACATRRNAVGFLIGVELMLNAAALNTVAYARFRAAPVDGDGQFLALMIIVLAAAEAATALAVLFAVYRTWKDIDLERTASLGGADAQDALGDEPQPGATP
jgi:NADH:ubiquinone oxidoreductase subunit K